MAPKTVTLPVGQKPKGSGWEISTGNTFLNVWVRKQAPKLRAKKLSPALWELSNGVEVVTTAPTLSILMDGPMITMARTAARMRFRRLRLAHEAGAAA